MAYKKATFTESVFVNFPFDDNYLELFRGLIFTVYYCGFFPRTALEEKARGLAAKDRLKAILEGAKTIQLCSHGVGKYGRCLGELHVDIVDGKEQLTLANVNELLIKEGHAVEYYGGKR